MNTDGPAPGTPRYPLLERATTLILLLVLLALGWMALAACFPQWDGLLPLDVQVGIVLALLTAALVLVSVVALLHTHS